MHPLKQAQTFARGESYWRVVLTTGRTYSKLDTVNDPTRGKRPLDWYLDFVATGDVRRIAELWLHTPQGPVALKITEPRSAYIFNSSFVSLDSGRSPVAQIIGRVDNRETGSGIAFIWDVAEQQLYKDTRACVRGFAAWRPGIAHIGALNVQALGLRLEGM